MMNGSWKPKVAGVLVAVIAVAGVVVAMLKGVAPDWMSAASAVMAAVGLFSARQDNKSSEDVGAK